MSNVVRIISSTFCFLWLWCFSFIAVGSTGLSGAIDAATGIFYLFLLVATGSWTLSILVSIILHKMTGGKPSSFLAPLLVLIVAIAMAALYIAVLGYLKTEQLSSMILEIIVCLLLFICSLFWARFWYKKNQGKRVKYLTSIVFIPVNSLAFLLLLVWGWSLIG